MEELCCKIECLRRNLQLTAHEKGISHPEVLIISQNFDEAVNELYGKYLAKKGR